MRGSARRLRGRSSRARALLLDSSYLLPLFGVDVRLRTPLGDLLSAGAPLYYNPVSLVEIKWVYYKLVRRGDISLSEARANYIRGLELLLRDKRFRETPLTAPDVERVADALHDLGVTDYFDRLIAATSIVWDLELVTDDRQLLDAMERYLRARRE